MNSRLPDTISYAEGALLEPLAVAIHSIKKADAKAGATCLVVGAGAVGLLTAAVAKSAGYSRVVMTDIVQSRLEFAWDKGFADAVVKLSPRTPSDVDEGLVFAEEDAAALIIENGGDPFTRTFECTGVESCVRISIYVSTLDFVPHRRD